RLPLLMSRIASRVTVLPDGVPLDDPTAQQLAVAGVAVRVDPVTGVRRTGPEAEGATHQSSATISFASGPDVEVDGIFVKTEMAQSAPFAEQLGLELLPSGCIKIDELGRTSRAGVYAAGDLAHLAALPMPLASVLAAASAGLVAASTAVQELLTEDHELPAPPMPPTPSTPSRP
ncbi:MAG: FAD-dependent oxidoreductase, partial [Nocardioidaceae bacterium]